MHDKPVNKIENKTEEREEDTEKFYVAEEGVPLYICNIYLQSKCAYCLLRKRNRIEPDDCIAPGRWNLFGKTSAAGRHSSLLGVWKEPAVFRCLLFTGRNS